MPTTPTTLTRCKRCGDPALGSDGGNGRPFRKAKRGYCTACAVCMLFQDERNGILFALNPQALLLPHIQQQFARVLAVGGSELDFASIDWQAVIAKWRLPK